MGAYSTLSNLLAGGLKREGGDWEGRGNEDAYPSVPISGYGRDWLVMLTATLVIDIIAI